MKLIVILALPFGDTVLPPGTVVTGDAADHIWEHENFRKHVARIAPDRLPDNQHTDPVTAVPQSLKDLADLMNPPAAPEPAKTVAAQVAAKPAPVSVGKEG